MKFLPEIYDVITSMSVIKKRSHIWSIGFGCFNGPTCRSLDFWFGYRTLSFMFPGGYGYQESYRRILQQ